MLSWYGAIQARCWSSAFDMKTPAVAARKDETEIDGVKGYVVCVVLSSLRIAWPDIAKAVSKDCSKGS